MKRLACLGLALAVAVIALATVLTPAGSSQTSTYQVDVIFDNARGLVPGQLVEIAGARVGSISDVTLTPDYKARVEMQIDGRFAPFRADASCSIRPQGLIAENSVLCDPGSPSAPQLVTSGGHHPTVPVTRTTEPVNLTDLFNIWDQPTRERFAVLISELGLAGSAEGQDLNSILLRTNPTLALARRVIGILQRQSAQLASSIDSTGAVVSQLAGRASRVRDFVDRAANVTTVTATHAGNLAAAIHGLPGLLATAQPALIQLDAVARSGTPLLAQLRAAAPGLNRLGVDLVPFARAATPALARIGATLVQGAGVARKAVPVSRVLASYAHQSLPVAQVAGRLFVNLRARGFAESLVSFVYYAAAATARFDSVSHIIPAHVFLSPCGIYSATPTPGCSANYSATAAATRHAASVRRAGAGVPLAPATRPSPVTPAAPSSPAPSTSAPAPQGLQQLQQATQQTIQSLLSRLPPAVQQLLPAGGSGGAGGSSNPDAIQQLLHFLLK
ncbi:MAG: MlaD family protein [Solirubrobacteraceae bacterium]